MRRFIILGLFLLTEQEQDYMGLEQSKTRVFDRLFYNMRVYAQEANARVTFMTKYRSSYERSAQFEMGYLMNEVMDRYRKIIFNMKGPIDKRARNDSLFTNLKRVDTVQKLFLEIYHLVNMIHEIRRKYKDMLVEERKAGLGSGGAELDKFDAIAAMKHARERERRKKRKWYAKQRQMILLGQAKEMNKTKRNKWWPIDYGWEIDYYW